MTVQSVPTANHLSSSPVVSSTPFMGGVKVTKHALKRWRERVSPCTDKQARAAILSHSSAIEKAAMFGAGTVRLGTRHRLILEGLTVVTVLGAARFSWDRFE